MRSLAILSLVAGCSLSEPGIATVQLSNRDGIPLANWPVVFHDETGDTLSSVLTNELGYAVGPMAHGGMVTYRSPFPKNELVTRGGLQPGDQVVDGGTADVVATPTSRIAISTPGAPAAARLVRIEVVCGNRILEQRGVPGMEIELDLPASCVRGGAASVFVLATATDETAQAIAYDLFTVDLGGTAPVPQWRTDFTVAPATIVGLDDDLVRYRVEAEAFLHGVAIAHAIHDGAGAVSSITAPLRLPAGLPGASHYRLDATLATGELIVEQDLFPDTAFVVGPTDLPPRLTAMALEGDAIAVTTERAIDEPFEIEAVLGTTDASWRVRMPGPIIDLPELDTSGFPLLPYFSKADLELIGVTVRYRRDEAVLTTAMPFATR